ncbi:MAG: 2-isopropylmalate synthase, partial [Deltaproteobacteria bacterium]|nr:2-isopropylmalate synthase [Deltaproteobacteria bacterium]
AASNLHMREKLHLTPEETIAQAAASVRQGAALCADVEFSAEDASRADPDFLVRLFGEAIAAGATTINLADTVGYAQPNEFADLVRFVRARTPGADKVVTGVHCHNDLGLGVANTLAGILAGARQTDVTLGGIGERAGNAALEEVVMALATRPDIYHLATGINTTQIYPSCRLLSMITGMPIPPNKAIVGGNAFAHESGIHQDGVLKNRATYEILSPKSIGRGGADLIIGKHSGRHAVKNRLEQLGFRLDKAQVQTVFDAVKLLADKKTAVQDEDLEALVLSEVYRIPDRYKLLDISVQTSSSNLPAVAAVSLEISGEVMRRAGFGIGPVDATFNVISQIVDRAVDLERFSINAITGGTDALGEVTVRLRENDLLALGHGSDSDIIIACAKSFVDALNRLDKKRKGKTP